MSKHKKPLLRIIAAGLILTLATTVLSIFGSSVTYTTDSDYVNGLSYTRLCELELTGHPRVDLVNVALSQYGYHEGNDIQDLDGESLGILNYTEFGRWFGIQGGQWCAMFVSWCAHVANIPENVILSHSYTATGVLWFMDRHQAWHRNDIQNGLYTPQAGDLIYFWSPRNNSIVNHVGIVLGYFDEYIYTIEGNVNFDPYCTDGGQALIRSYHISDTFVQYVCCPNYSSDVTHEIQYFFPDIADRPVAPDAEIVLGTPTEDPVETPDAPSASESPQYNFIP